MRNLSLLALIEMSFFAVFALLIDMFIPSIKPIPSISISAAMIPIFILTFRWGIKAGMISGLLWGLLQIAVGEAWIVNPLQAFIEYFLAFSFIGLAGLFTAKIQSALSNKNKKEAIAWITIAIIAGSTARYFWHFLAGIFFWGSLAADGFSVVWFSFWTNGLTMIGSAILCSILAVFVLNAAPQFVARKNSTTNLSH